MSAFALENDLDPTLTQALAQPGLSKRDVPGTGGGAGPAVDLFTPFLVLTLVGQDDNQGDDVERARSQIILGGILTKVRLVIQQTNTGGGNYYARYYDTSTSAYVYMTVGGASDSLATGGTQDQPYVSAFFDILPAAIAANDISVEIFSSGTGGTTDVSYAALEFTGPTITSQAGPKGDKGDPGANGANGSAVRAQKYYTFQPGVSDGLGPYPSASPSGGAYSMLATDEAVYLDTGSVTSADLYLPPANRDGTGLGRDVTLLHRNGTTPITIHAKYLSSDVLWAAGATGPITPFNPGETLDINPNGSAEWSVH